MPTHFEIIYMIGNRVLAKEKRTHFTKKLPSEKMVTNALHTLCLDNDYTDFETAKAELYREGSFLCSYRIAKNKIN